MSVINLVGADLSAVAARIVLHTVNAGGEAFGEYDDKTFRATLRVGAGRVSATSPQSYSEAVLRAAARAGFH